jgi:hypothetical protein
MAQAVEYLPLMQSPDQVALKNEGKKDKIPTKELNV